MKQILEQASHLPRYLLDWLCSGYGSYRACQRRKASTEYRRRKRIAVWIWIGAGALVLTNPTLQILLVSGLTACFFSLAVLDGG